MKRSRRFSTISVICAMAAVLALTGCIGPWVGPISNEVRITKRQTLFVEGVFQHFTGLDLSGRSAGDLDAIHRQWERVGVSEEPWEYSPDGY